MPMPVSDRRKVCVQFSQYIPSVGCSVVVEERDVAVETGASSDTMAPPQSDALLQNNTLLQIFEMLTYFLSVI